MRRFFNGLVVGITFGAVVYWFVQAKVRQNRGAEQRFETTAVLMHNSAGSADGYFSDTFTAKLEALDLLPGEIKQELAHNGMIVRRKAHDIGEKAANATSDARARADIRAKYATDPDLSGWQIAVTCQQGQVELSGMVPTPDDIGRAMALALETDGVRDVISTLQAENNG